MWVCFLWKFITDSGSEQGRCPASVSASFPFWPLRLSLQVLWSRVQGETDGLRSFGLYKNFKETNKPKQTLTTDSGFLSEGQDFWTQYSDKTVFLGRNEGERMKCVMWMGRSTETGWRTCEHMACPGGLPTSSSNKGKLFFFNFITEQNYSQHWQLETVCFPDN